MTREGHMKNMEEGGFLALTLRCWQQMLKVCLVTVGSKNQK